MNTTTLRAFMKANRVSQSELARRVGVSRQAVSLWLRAGEVANPLGRHLLRICQVLGVRAEQLVQPLPCFDAATDARLRATLLWDSLYADLDDLAIAVKRGSPRAVARLVEVYGMFATEKIIGKTVWKQFPDYKRFIPPTRRQQLETLCSWRDNQTAS